MKRVLLDTDVILDFFFDRKPFSEDAAKVLGLCELKVVTGFITPVILSNVYYLLRQTDKHDKIIDKLQQLMEIIDVLLIDKNIIKQALNSDFKDFEDALQNFSAEKDGKIDVIITRNMKDFRKSRLGVMTPKDYLKLV
jgi:predicted nucleic acid-binding protein